MYKYKRAYKYGYNEGIKDATNDLNKNNIKKYKEIDDTFILSRLYDIGYIEGYNKIIKIRTLNNKQNIV